MTVQWVLSSISPISSVYPISTISPIPPISFIAGFNWFSGKAEKDVICFIDICFSSCEEDVLRTAISKDV